MLSDEDFLRIEQLLDAKLEAKLDAKLDAKLAQLEARFNKTLQPIYTEIKEIKNEIGMLKDYNEIDAKGVEGEVSSAVRVRLTELYPGCKITRLLLKNLFAQDPVTRVKRQVTDFDGAFLVSNYGKLDKYNVLQETTDKALGERRSAAAKQLSKDSVVENMELRLENPVHVIVIVEGKHVVTQSRVNNKIKTLSTILDMVVKAKGYFNRKEDGRPDSDFDANIVNLVKNFDFHKVTNVQLYVGAPVWHDGMIEYIREIATGRRKQLRYGDSEPLDERMEPLKEQHTLAEMAEFNQIGMVFPDGSRYQIADFYNRYDPANEVAPINGGGRSVRRKLRVRTLRFYIPVKFT